MCDPRRSQTCQGEVIHGRILECPFLSPDPKARPLHRDVSIKVENQRMSRTFLCMAVEVKNDGGLLSLPMCSRIFVCVYLCMIMSVFCVALCVCTCMLLLCVSLHMHAVVCLLLSLLFFFCDRKLWSSDPQSGWCRKTSDCCRSHLVNHRTWSPDQYHAVMLADISLHILGWTGDVGDAAHFRWAPDDRSQCCARRWKIIVCLAVSSVLSWSGCNCLFPVSFEAWMGKGLHLFVGDRVHLQSEPPHWPSG